MPLRRPGSLCPYQYLRRMKSKFHNLLSHSLSAQMCISALFTTPVTCGCKPRRTRGDRDVNPTQLTHFKLQRLGKSNFTASYLLKPPLLSIDLVFMKHRDSH